MPRLTLALLAVLLAPGAARAADLSCPPTLEVTAAARLTAPAGWEVVQRPAIHALEFAELFIGDPAKRVQLRGEDGDYPRLVFWELTPEAEGYTVICRYQDTQAVLQSAVPREARRCEIRIQAANGQPLRRGQAVPRDARTVAACR